MSIFENLENLEVSESCFNDILDIVEELLSEGNHLYNIVNRHAEKRGYLVPNYLKLKGKALSLPGTNDVSYSNGELQFHGDMDKNKSSDELGQERNDRRHEEHGKDISGIKKKRKKDEENNFIKASIKSALRKNK